MKWPIWKDFGWPDACMGPCRTVPAIPGEVQGALGKWHSVGAVLWEAGSSGGRISVNICSSSNCPALRCWLFRAALQFAAGLGLAFKSHRPLSTTELSRGYKILPKDWKIPEKHLSGSSLYAAFFPPFPEKALERWLAMKQGCHFLNLLLVSCLFFSSGDSYVLKMYSTAESSFWPNHSVCSVL